MTTIQNLQHDLQQALDFFADDFNAKTNGEWICAIDPECMDLLKSIWKKADGSYSLSSLAHTIRLGKPIKGL